MSCHVLSVLPILSSCMLSCLEIGKNMGTTFYLVLSCSVALACILLLFLFIGGNMGRSSVLPYLYNMGRSSVLSYPYNMCRSSVLSLYVLDYPALCIILFVSALLNIYA